MEFLKVMIEIITLLFVVKYLYKKIIKPYDEDMKCAKRLGEKQAKFYDLMIEQLEKERI